MPGQPAPRLPVTFRLRLAMVATIVVPGLLFLSGAWYDWNRILSQAHMSARLTTELLREHAQKALDASEWLIRETDWRIHGMDWDAIRANRDALVLDMRAAVARYPQISFLGVADAQGREWAGVRLAGKDQPEPGFDVSGREFWRGQRDADAGTLVSRPYVGRHTHRTNIAVSRRRTGPGDGFDGTIETAIQTSYFTAFWEKALAHQPLAKVALLRDDGSLLASFPATGTVASRLDLPSDATGIFDPLVTRTALDREDQILAAAQVGAFPVRVAFIQPVASLRYVWLQRMAALGSVCLLACAALLGTLVFAARQGLRLTEERARRTEAEEQALGCQRLEVLGQLAAGVAHDFANVMQVVEGNAVMIQRRSADERVNRLAGRIISAAEQGRSLTARMMDFARGGTDPPNGPATLVDPAEAVAAAAGLLSSTLQGRYEVECVIERDGLPQLVQGDRAGLQGAVMNLAINARDAMPEGGRITITVTRAELPIDAVATAGTRDDLPSPDRLPAGVYVRIAVSDTGCGMTDDVLARAGQAFFTTKPRGRGTGLGLAGVRGFVVRHGGGMTIDSAPGLGTTIALWLPDDSRAGAPAEAPPASERIARRHANVNHVLSVPWSRSTEAAPGRRSLPARQ